MRGPGAEHNDFKTFANPTSFASCYQSYAQSLLPYAATAAAPFTSVTVQPTTVATPASSRVHAEAFVITRSGHATEVTTAVAVFGGRMQATLALASPSSFPATVESSLVSAVEGRVAGNLPAVKAAPAK